MSAGKNNKEEFKKYLKGELNEAEQHRLEKASLDDPFLEEAIEGAAAS